MSERLHLRFRNGKFMNKRLQSQNLLDLPIRFCAYDLQKSSFRAVSDWKTKMPAAADIILFLTALSAHFIIMGNERPQKLLVVKSINISMYGQIMLLTSRFQTYRCVCNCSYDMNLCYEFQYFESIHFRRCILMITHSLSVSFILLTENSSKPFQK